MRVFILFFILFSSKAATQLLSFNDIENLISKFMQNQLTEEENNTARDTLELLRRPQHISVRSFDTSSLARLSIECIICRSALRVVFQNIKDGQSEEQVADAVVRLCTSLGIESYNVCYGAVVLNLPIIVHIIRTVPEATPEAGCGLVLQNANDRNVCPFDDPRFEWQVQLPARSVVNTIPKSNDEPLKVAVITDAHIDPLYEAFGVAECDAPTCCRVGQVPRSLPHQSSDTSDSLFEESVVKDYDEIKLNLSVASRIREENKMSRSTYQHKRTAAPAGYWGDYRNCDTPIWAFDDAIKHIHENHKDIDVVYYMGDTIDHGIWETSFELINNMNRYLIDKIRTTFGDHVLVVPVIGNHESQPTNQFAPARVVGDKLNTTWLYQTLADKWQFYLPQEARNTLLERGEFSLLVRPGLRVISLNNNVAYRYNWWLIYDPLDAKNHLDWLIQELHKAELAGEKVHILAHIPPGVHDLTYTWTREYNRIVNRFSATIAAEFNGHTHSDEFKVFYSPEGTPINVAWGAGAVTAYTFYNLNYKIATFDSNTFAPARIVNYVYNLTEANLTPNRRPHWFMLYDMKNSFGLTDLSAQSMHNLIYSMVDDKRRLLYLYAAFYSKVSDARWPDCDNNCKIDNLCKTVVTVLWERQRCDELKQAFNS